MTTAIWVIAICEVIRIVQNSLQLIRLYAKNNSLEDMQKNAYQEFVKSLNKTDKQFVEELLEELKENL